MKHKRVKIDLDKLEKLARQGDLRAFAAGPHFQKGKAIIYYALYSRPGFRFYGYVPNDDILRPRLGKILAILQEGQDRLQNQTPEPVPETLAETIH